MAWKKNLNSSERIKKSQKILTLILVVSLIIIGIFFWRFYNKPAEDAGSNADSSNTTTEGSQIETKEAPKFDAVALQNVIDAWVESIPGVSSVVIADTSANVLATYNQTRIYFAASIYKLYVAYAGYQQVDRGKVDPNEIYVNGFTRYECLDKMIRESYSPCAEKLWNELGKDELTEQLKTYGIENTSMEGITTTAADASIMLARIARGEGLSAESQAAYLSSMKDQEALYRRGLPTGFKTLTVYNKVGWNEQVEWHDASIAEMPDGRRLIVSVFTENVGSANIAKLGTAIESSITQ